MDLFTLECVVDAVDLSLHAERKSVFHSHTNPLSDSRYDYTVMVLLYETVVIAHGVVGSCENQLILHGGVS